MTAYTLGVDLGTTYSAAVVGRGGQVNTLQLGAEGAVVPSVVVIREDGEVLVGDAAERRASAEPARSAREFKRRLGDPVPLIVGDQPYTVEALMGYQLADIVRRATEQEGEAPTTVVLTHPANYTDFKLGKLREAATLAGLEPERVQLLAEPEAAAISYTRDQKVEPGDVIAVYDFGGGTFDAALVRNTATGFELIGIPEGMERLGGIDFDQAVLAHVDQSVGGMVTGADRSDPLTLPAQARLRVECRRAKEALSTDADTTIPVALPGLQTDVRLTRAEFESMVRPRIAQTVTALERTVASAGLTMDGVSRVLLVGGTSRMPVVAEMIRSATGRPVGLDAHPKLAIATGAALAGGSTVAAAAPEPVAEWVAPTRVVPVAPPPPEKSGGGKRILMIVVAAAAAALIGFFAFTMLSGDDDEATPGDSIVDPVVTEVGPVESGVVTVPATEAPAGSTAPVESAAPETTEAPTTEPPSTEAPVPPAGGNIENVATIDTQSMGLAIDDSGAIVAAGADSAILQITDVDSVSVLGTVPDGVPGGVAVAPDGEVVVSTSAGVRQMSDGALVLDGATAGLGSTPGPLAFDGVGNLYLADNDNNRIVRMGTDGSLSLVAGNGSDPAGAPPADGAAIDVAIGPVTGIAIDGTGRLLFADAGTNTVRAIVADGTISTLVGGGATALDVSSGIPDGTTARDLALGSVSGLSVAGNGRIAVSDDVDGAILIVDTDGSLSIVASRAATDPSQAIGTVGPLAFESRNTLAFADGVTIRRISGL